MAPLPESYNTFVLPELRFSHHPASSAAVTPVVLVILNRPHANNAFTEIMTESLVAAFDTLSTDPRVKAVVMTGSDPKNRIFCAGMDLNAAQGRAGGTSSSEGRQKKEREEDRASHRDGGGRVALSIYNCSKPVIAALNGSAVGVGITMTLAANIRIASSRGKIGFVFARRGICNEATSSFFLPRLVGGGRACHLLTTGGLYPASHPLFSGLFSEVVAPEKVVETALGIAEEVAANTSAVSTRVMKDLMFRGPGSPEEAHLLESRLFYDLFKGRDAKEGIVSFLEKRGPRFEGTVEQVEDRPAGWPWWEEAKVGKTGKSKI